MCDLARALANTDREGAGPGLAGHQPAQSQLQLQSRPAGRAGLQVSRQSGTSRWRIRWDSTHLRPTGWISCQQQRDAVCLLADWPEVMTVSPLSPPPPFVPLTSPVISPHLMQKFSSKTDWRREALHYNALSGGERGETSRAVFGQKAGLYSVWVIAFYGNNLVTGWLLATSPSKMMELCMLACWFLITDDFNLCHETIVTTVTIVSEQTLQTGPDFTACQTATNLQWEKMLFS